MLTSSTHCKDTDVPYIWIEVPSLDAQQDKSDEKSSEDLLGTRRLEGCQRIEHVG